jgi:hypothetical protein
MVTKKKYNVVFVVLLPSFSIAISLHEAWPLLVPAVLCVYPSVSSVMVITHQASEEDEDDREEVTTVAFLHSIHGLFVWPTCWLSQVVTIIFSLLIISRVLYFISKSRRHSTLISNPKKDMPTGTGIRRFYVTTENSYENSHHYLHKNAW